MNTNKRTLQIIVLDGVLLVMAVVIDRYLPNRVIVASLYTLPMLVAALFYGSGIIIATGSVAIIVYVIEATYEGTHVITLLSSVLGFAVIGFLALQFSHQRARALQKAEEARRARKKLEIFLGMVAHDIAQPITAIKLYLGLLPEEQNAKVKRLRKGLDFAVGFTEELISDLWDAAAIESGSFTLHKEKTDVVGLLKLVMRQQQVKNRTIKLVAPKTIMGDWDRKRLTQLFSNLLSNAVKYSGDNKRINISVTAEKKTMLARIADNGLGMTKEQLSEMFEPFTRFHKEKAKGTGLGLYISYWIVNAHGGKIWAESKIGRGTTFYVRLPRS